MFSGAHILKLIAALLVGAVSYVLPTQTLRDLAIGLGVFVVLDTVTGIIAARVDGHAVSSAKFSRLLTKLIGYLSVVLVATLAARNVPNFSDLAPAATAATLSLAMVTEGISILENLDRMGMPVPKFIREAFRSSQENPKK